MVQANNSITALTSRRNFIASSAALAVASASPALAFPALGQDAELIELGRQLEISTVQYREASELSSRLLDVAYMQYPPLPDVLKARDTDRQFNLPEPNDERFSDSAAPFGKMGYYTTFHLNELKQCKPKRSLRIPADQYVTEYFRGNGHECPALYFKSDKTVLTTQSWPEAQARVDELIAAIEVWRKATQKALHESGHMKAERDFNRIGKKHYALIDKISEIEATSLQGILVKARTVQLFFEEDEEVEFGDGSDMALVASIVNGLLAFKA